MIAKAKSGTTKGINAIIITVEADNIRGMPSFSVVGLPDSAVKESKERVKSALNHLGHDLSISRITINLSPGDVKKEGTQFDLPMAVAILGTTGYLPQISLDDSIFIGELSLDGLINPVRGVLSIVHEASEKGIRRCFVPKKNAEEAALVEGIEILPAENLLEVTNHLLGKALIEPLRITGKRAFKSGESHNSLDFADVKGQERTKRAFAIAAAGQHNILLIGPPGVGKTMLAKRLPTIMPPLSFEESLEITKIFSVKGLLNDRTALITERPFRTTHHTLSHVSLVGGGRPPLPGEVSLAHLGVLFIDEIPLYSSGALETLRLPLEDKKVVINRESGSVTYPSNFMLVAAANPCPCGYSGIPEKCKCTKNEIANYQGRLSGPLLDRIDMHISLPAVKYEDLNEGGASLSSAELYESVENAIHMQARRFEGENFNFNAHMDSSHVEKYCKLGDVESKMLKDAYTNMGLSARAYHRILRLARTIADFDNSDSIEKWHLTEAIQYRNLDRSIWR